MAAPRAIGSAGNAPNRAKKASAHSNVPSPAMMANQPMFTGRSPLWYCTWTKASQAARGAQNASSPRPEPGTKSSRLSAEKVR